MFLTALNILLEISFMVFVFVILIAVGSVFIVRHLQTEFKKAYRVQSRFDIELRKLLNIMRNFHEIDSLEKYRNLVIKKLSHDEKQEILQTLEKAYYEIDVDDETNAYIVETYNRLQVVRRDRDSKVIVYNDKLSIFPFNIYAKIMKLEKFKVYTRKE